MSRVSGKKALITGGAQGLGEATAWMLAREGAKVAVTDVNGDGDLTPADFTSWILAFNTQAPECDQNGDGICGITDFSPWIRNFNAGC